MKGLQWLFVLAFCLPHQSFSQHIYYSVRGQVTHEGQTPLTGANVILNSGEKTTITDKDGKFVLAEMVAGKYILEVSYLGYEKYTGTLNIVSDTSVVIMLKPQFQTLEEVAVVGEYSGMLKREDPTSIESVNKQYIKNYLSGNLMKTLDRLPGVSAIEIGSGQSKPLIRGLGFNRVVVVENGIKHEGQQWGEEHGLEIDQYAIDRIEIIKSPASLMYGSDAIGGVINLKQIEIPAENTFGGMLDMTGKSNNNLLGISFNAYARKNRAFVSGRYTMIDYADYHIPAGSVDIYSYSIPLFRNRLRNTAGNEQYLHFSIGSIGKHFFNRLFISNMKNKVGFFANAHGLEPRNVDMSLHDKSARDIHYPFQEVNHFKISAKSTINHGINQIEAIFGYQNNFRQEWSQYVAHGYMPAVFPDSLSFPDVLELQFDKDVYSGALKNTISFSDKFSLTTGFNSELQKNCIDGRGFIIPGFRQFTMGVYMYDKFSLSEKIILHAGLRYDFGNIEIKEYYDWFKSPVINDHGDTTHYDYLQRTAGLNRRFTNICWSVGINYNGSVFSLKANIGKSFRMPIAKELAANGVNYHHFSYEVGNPKLSSEVSYQFDLGLEWKLSRIVLGLSPFLGYFPNYIYLNPSYRHDYLYGAGHQIFYYTQSEVLRAGGEIHLHYNVLKQVKAGVVGEYVYSEQLSGEKKGFTLPFSPPANVLLNLNYSPGIGKMFNETYISVDYKLVAAQNKIVPPERKTKGSQIVNISVGSKFEWKEQFVSVNFQVQNLFNSKYFNHTSYYRIINVPEAGRNFIINLSIPFEHQTGKNRK